MTLILEPKTKIEQHTQVEQKQEYKFIGSMKLKPGHSLFKYNILKKEMIKVEVERKISVGIDQKPIKENKVLFENDCIYITALNKKNAYKKLIKTITKSKLL